jgi:preprotein translocase subunit SecF
MIDILGKRRLYYFFSLLVIVPGLISLGLYGMKLSIDFTGGSRMTFVSKNNIQNKDIDSLKQIISSEKGVVASVQKLERTVIMRTAPFNEKQNAQVIEKITEKKLSLKEESFETVGPTIGKETTLNALKATGIAAFLILLYIAWSFRKVPKPASSWRFAVCTIIALLHDALVVLGVFSLFGHFLGVEIDSLFVTAVLTVIGFSVHDTIVVFDRIRENLLKVSGKPFEQIVNDSILQTLGRSLNTSITALLVLFSLLLFGGQSIHWFAMALFIGIASGTYSSIFNAAPLLVTWNEWDKKRKNKKQEG